MEMGQLKEKVQMMVLVVVKGMVRILGKVKEMMQEFLQVKIGKKVPVRVRVKGKTMVRVME